MRRTTKTGDDGETYIHIRLDIRICIDMGEGFIASIPGICIITLAHTLAWVMGFRVILTLIYLLRA